jgi:hydrophobic/amphiphilic exporter-1 (mainly G- bacteria), HAE1 family
MWHLTRLSLRLGPVVVLAVLLLFGGGIWAATQLQQDLLPDISVPAFGVVTSDPGASPDVVDQQVTVPLATALQGVTGVNSVNSTSTSGASIIQVLFNDGTDTQTDQQNLSSALERARGSLPSQAAQPTLTAFSTSQVPILRYAISGDESQGDLAAQLRSIAVPQLQGLTGVTSVTLDGAPLEEVQVTLDPAQLAAHGMTMSQVVSALQQAALVQSVGTVQDGGATVPIQVSKSLTSLDQISNLQVSPSSGAAASRGPGRPLPVTIGDLGSVKQVAVPADTISRTNGRLSIGLRILKSPTANTVMVANEIKSALPGIQSRMGHGTQFQIIQDQAAPITDAIASILREGLLGAAFAVLVIFAFLRSVRATIVAAVSIPLSLLVALLILWWQGITLNILTLGAMMVAIGRVVDDAIVVLENISRHVSQGDHPIRAAGTGSRQILTAVTSSTLTTVAVFLPIAFLSGIAGDFFRPFALTVVTALLASLAVAVTVVPLLASRLLSRPQRARSETDLTLIQRVYVPAVRWSLRHRALTVIAATMLLVISVAMVPRIRVNLLDQSSNPSFPVAITMPQNSTLAQTDAETQKVEALIRSVPDVSAYQATAGGSQDPFAPPGAVPADPSKAEVLILIAQSGTYNEVMGNVKSALAQYRGPAQVSAQPGQGGGGAASNQVQLTVQSSDPATLATGTNQVVSALASVADLSQVTSNLAASKPQYNLVPSAALVQSGLTLQQLGSIVAQATGGQVATQADLPSGPVQVRVLLPPTTTDTPDGLAALSVPTPQGAVPLSTLASLQQVPGPPSINRSDGQRAATITATITGDNTQAVQNQVNRDLAELKLPSGVSVSTGGVFSQLSTVLNQFALAILGAIGLVYLIMVATFRSLLKPLVLLAAIPFAAIGAILALVLTRTSLSLPSLVGLLMLVGIVVTNAIVLLDLVEQYRDRGLDVEQALIEGGRLRLRPILMTALATMLALVPLALSGSSGGSFISAPLAVVVIGGLFTSTLLTLVLVPVIYSSVSRFTRPRVQQSMESLLKD